MNFQDYREDSRERSQKKGLTRRHWFPLDQYARHSGTVVKFDWEPLPDKWKNNTVNDGRTQMNGYRLIILWNDPSGLPYKTTISQAMLNDIEAQNVLEGDEIEIYVKKLNGKGRPVVGVRKVG